MTKVKATPFQLYRNALCMTAVRLEDAEDVVDAAKGDTRLSQTERAELMRLFYVRAYQDPAEAQRAFVAWMADNASACVEREPLTQERDTPMTSHTAPVFASLTLGARIRRTCYACRRETDKNHVQLELRINDEYVGVICERCLALTPEGFAAQCHETAKNLRAWADEMDHFATVAPPLPSRADWVAANKAEDDAVIAEAAAIGLDLLQPDGQEWPF